MHCNGNCHLKKVVQNNTEDSTIPFKDIDYKEILLFVVEPIRYEFLRVSIKKIQKVSYKNLYAYSLVKAFDHPPQV